MCSDSSGGFARSGLLTARELYDAASERVTRAKVFPSASVELALASPDRQVRLAANLYRVTVGIQGLDLVSAQRALVAATEQFDGTEDPRLQWWYHHLDGLCLIATSRFVEGRAALGRAIDAARRGDGLDLEIEWSKANALASYARDGNAPQVASGLLDLLREKESTELGPVFYQLVSYLLHWLGEFEFAYSLRLHGMQTSNATPARSVRDHREFARILIGLGRLDEAERHLQTAMEWNPHATAEEAVRTLGAAVKLAVARNDVSKALQLLDEMSYYGAPGPRHEPAIVSTAELLVRQGDTKISADLLDALDPAQITPWMRPKVLSVRAEIAAQRGDHKTSLRLFRRAADAPQLARAPAETIVAICREISPWLSRTGPNSVFPPVAESRFFDGSRWLMATARDMRRSMAPSRLALESDIGPDAKLDVLQATVDDLNLLGSFLADGAGPADSRVPDDFWTLHAAAERVVNRAGATLRTEPEPGTVFHHDDTGLAGRMAFGLVSIVADHASPGSELVLRVDEQGFVIDASAITTSGLARMQNVLTQLCAPFRARNVTLPSRASFVATYRAALSSGWSVDVANAADGAMTVSVIFGKREPSRDERYLFAASPAVTVEEAPAPKPPTPPSSNPELLAVLADYHERRLDAPEFDLSLIEVARAEGDIDLLASTLLVAAAAEMWLGRRRHASELLDELREITASYPHLETEIWPAPLFAKNREYWLHAFRGDVASTWIAATENMFDAFHQDSLLIRMTGALNWAKAEVERGALGSAWLFSNMCDPTRTSEQGRLLELCVHHYVLLAEGHFDAAVPVSQERLALAHAESFIPRASALALHVRTMSAVGRFSEAWASVNAYAELHRERQSPLVEALAASVLWAEGRRDEAYAEAVRAREDEDFAFGAETLSLSIPIEAEALLARGEPEAAQRLLDAFPIDRQRFLDLPRRLDIEDRVAAALGDHDRRIDVARALFSLRTGVPRWNARQHPIYYEFWRTMEAAVRNDRQRIEAEQAAVAAVVTHDLRNSLTAVTLATELAAVSPDAAIIDRAGQALEPIRSLAGQLDAVAQWDGAWRVVADDLVDIAELLASVEFPNKSVYELSGGVLEVRSDLPEGLVVPTKRNMLAIILSNLVGNAIKHGRRDGTVRVSATSHIDADGGGESVVIAVDDDGPGLSPHHAARLREGSKAPIEPARGLGLWIVRRYAAALGLPVEVRTSELGGTRVAVYLKLTNGGPSPAAMADRPDRRLALAPERPARVCTTGPVGAGASGHRVMVVEDDVMLSTLVVELLVRHDKHVATAATADEAIRLLANDTFDMVLTDIDLADGSTGYDVLASMYAQGLAPKVVVMSGQAIDQTRLDLTRQFGAPVAVLQKPFTPEDLFAAVGV